MATLAVLIWVWSLAIFPLTSILTFILTLVVCSVIPNNAPVNEKYPEISELGTGEAHIYFLIGFVVLFPQLIIIILGRIQFLFQNQLIVNRALIGLIHLIAVISGIFMLIMAIVSVDDRVVLHDIGAYGMFGSISLYCFLHAILLVYLFLHRSDAPQHSNIFYPIWFVLCSLLLIVFFAIWIITEAGIPQYIAAASPFLYLLGFVPQFWSQARTRKLDYIVPMTVEFTNSSDA